MKICSVDGCDREQFCRGYCSRHYKQFRKEGTLPVIKPQPKPNVGETDLVKLGYTLDPDTGIFSKEHVDEVIPTSQEFYK